MEKETLEEASERFYEENAPNITFLMMAQFGAEFQAERMYSEEEVTKLLISCKDRFGGSELYDYTHDDEVKEWFESYKKK